MCRIAGRISSPPSDGVSNGLLFANLITAERHIAHDERVSGSADNTLCEKNHLIHGNGQCVRIAANNIACAVADQKNVNTGFID